MKEHTAPAAPMPYAHIDVEIDWNSLSRKAREKTVRRALKNRDVDTLWSLTHHNLLIYGRGGSHTSAHTLRSYRTGVAAFLRYAFPLGWKRMTEYDTDLTIGYLRHLETLGLQPGTVNARRSAARALYRALRWAGVLAADPFGDTPRAADPVARWERRDAYSREDVQKLLAAADEDERLVLLLAAHGGLRMSEVVSLRWEHVNLREGVMRVKGKGGKVGTVHLSQQLAAALAAREDKSGFVSPYQNPKSVREHLRYLCQQAGVRYERRHFHGLRHSAATMLLADTGDLFVVARHLRHSSVSTTEHYAKFDSSKLSTALKTWGESALN